MEYVTHLREDGSYQPLKEHLEGTATRSAKFAASFGASFHAERTALLHDIGIFISFSRHNAHSHYLIRNTELLGFTRREVDIMAALTYFHRKRPSKKVPLFMEFDQETREEIRLLSLFLLLAERMDKSHRQIVRTVRFEARKEGGLQLSLRAPEECPIERDLVRGSAKLVRKVFRQEIPVEVVSSFRR